jgi:hypothetical protein
MVDMLSFEESDFAQLLSKFPRLWWAAWVSAASYHPDSPFARSFYFMLPPNGEEGEGTLITTDNH